MSQDFVVYRYLVFALMQNTSTRGTLRHRKRVSYGVENPCDVVIRYRENGFAYFSEFVEVREGVDGLVESTGQSAEDYGVALYLRG